MRSLALDDVIKSFRTLLSGDRQAVLISGNAIA